MAKKKFFKNDDPAQYRYFNFRTWSNMTETEQAMWDESDTSPWPKEPKSKKPEMIQKMNKTQTEKSLNNLRLKSGQRFNLGSAACELIRWGQKHHLILMDYSKNDPDREARYATMQRTTVDSSYGVRDTLNTFQNYTSYDTKEDAELAYEHANR